jgi:PAS domain-containing protein
LPAEVGRQFENALQEIEQRATHVAFEYKLPVDGQKCIFEARLSRLYEDEVVALVRDITERKQAESALQEADAKLRIALGESEQHAREAIKLTELVDILQSCQSDTSRTRSWF